LLALLVAFGWALAKFLAVRQVFPATPELSRLATLAGPWLAKRLRPRLVRGRSWRSAAWIPLPTLLLIGLGGLMLRPRDYREETLRRLSLVGLFAQGPSEAVGARTVSATQQALIGKLLGPPSDAGRLAFAPLARRPRNVVLWVWESIGARYLRSLSPLGEAATPNLDAAMARGAVDFSQAYAECPLTVQTTWALMTGLSPPAKPFVFALYGYRPGVQFPRSGPILTRELRRAGYRIGLFYSSYTRMWGTFRIFQLGPLDVLEDGDTLGSEGNVQEGLGVDDEVTERHALAWLGDLDRSRPFLLVFWNSESHKPYTWSGMPDALRAADDLSRYEAVIGRQDRIFGHFYSELVRRGLADDTLVVVVGDHGEGLGRPPRPWDHSHSFRVFEDDIQVPLLFLNPGLRSGSGPPLTRVSSLVSHVDLFPTLLDLLGLPAVSGIDGRSAARLWTPRPFFARSLVWCRWRCEPVSTS
jgi:Sulfatase